MNFISTMAGPLRILPIVIVANSLQLIICYFVQWGAYLYKTQ